MRGLCDCREQQGLRDRTSGLQKRLASGTDGSRENIPTALALVPNKRPKALKTIMDEAGCKLFG